MDMNWLEALLLGIVQGVTEWLPVSSSGHLQLVRAFTGLEPDVALDLWLHVATLLAVLLVYRIRLTRLIHAVVQPRPESEADRRFAWALVVGTLPIVLVGLTLRDVVEQAFQSLFWVGVAFLATAIWLLGSTRSSNHPIRMPAALVVGLAQAVALFPGASRSGWTMGMALRLGWDRETAADFAFLLAVPALLGAILLESVRGMVLPSGIEWLAVLVAFVSGILSLRWLRAYVGRNGIHAFGPYVLVAAIVAFALS